MKKIIINKKTTLVFIVVLCLISLLSCCMLFNVAKAYELNAFYFVDTENIWIGMDLQNMIGVEP